MTKNISSFISVITNMVNNVSDCYFEEAPHNAVLPYSIISGELIIDLEAAESGDMITFDIDVYADVKQLDATKQMLMLCDKIQNFISTHNIVKQEGCFYSHLSIEAQEGKMEQDADLYHKRISVSARIFFIGG